MKFYNFFFIMSKPRKCWPIRNCTLIISRYLQYKCIHEIHAHTCSNPPGMYIKVVINLFF